jgi:hypothetical protein
MMKATLEDVLSGDVEIPASVQHYLVRDSERWLVHSGQADDISADLWEMFKSESSLFGKKMRDSWPASCEWVVSWEEKGDT